MKKLILEIVLQITGLSSASGLYYTNNDIYLIGDDSQYLYQYSLETKDLNKIALVENAKETISKKEKPDFEALTYQNQTFFAFGSGSKENREFVSITTLPNKESFQVPLDVLYTSIANFASMDKDELNIEGAFFKGDELYLFNRGNGKNNRNFIAIIQGKNFAEEFNIILQDIKLPKLNGIQTGFSDAILVENTIYFLATAEGGKSTYNDGKIAGTILGTISLKNLKLKSTQILSDTKKLEGITLFKQTGKNKTFLLCEDNDDKNATSTIFKVEVKK